MLKSSAEDNFRLGDNSLEVYHVSNNCPKYDFEVLHIYILCYLKLISK